LSYVDAPVSAMANDVTTVVVDVIDRFQHMDPGNNNNNTFLNQQRSHRNVKKDYADALLVDASRWTSIATARDIDAALCSLLAQLDCIGEPWHTPKPNTTTTTTTTATVSTSVATENKIQRLSRPLDNEPENGVISSLPLSQSPQQQPPQQQQQQQQQQPQQQSEVLSTLIAPPLTSAPVYSSGNTTSSSVDVGELIVPPIIHGMYVIQLLLMIDIDFDRFVVVVV
jgi:hypothetical protein